MKVFLPISIDRWRSPLATLCRAIVENNPNIEFASFSNPISEEDKHLGHLFWNLPNIKKVSALDAGFSFYDIVHTVSLNPRNLAIGVYSKAASFGKCIFLNTINLEHDVSMASRDWRCYQSSLNFVDYYCAVSNAAATCVKKNAPDRFLHVIPNGYDSDYFNPNFDYRCKLLENMDVLKPNSFALCVGALEPRKHPEFIVELAKHNTDVEFVCAGYVHPDGKHFLPMMKSLPNLHWLGHVDRSCIRFLLSRAAVFLFPSEREGLPLSVIEAMGMGVPVIAQSKSSLPELIVNENCGRLIDIDHPHAVEMWTNSLNNYMKISQILRGQRRNALAVQAKYCYSWEKIGAAYGRLYNFIMHKERC